MSNSSVDGSNNSSLSNKGTWRINVESESIIVGVPISNAGSLSVTGNPATFSKLNQLSGNTSIATTSAFIYSLLVSTLLLNKYHLIFDYY